MSCRRERVARALLSLLFLPVYVLAVLVRHLAVSAASKSGSTRSFRRLG